MNIDEIRDWLKEEVPHYECEDCWYSCATICCDEGRRSEKCDCGADAENEARRQILLFIDMPRAEAVRPEEATAREAALWRAHLDCSWPESYTDRKAYIGRVEAYAIKHQFMNKD